MGRLTDPEITLEAVKGVLGWGTTFDQEDQGVRVVSETEVLVNVNNTNNMVMKTEKDGWTCSCDAFHYSSKEDKTCKHLEEVRSLIFALSTEYGPPPGIEAEKLMEVVR